jgi:hypothetical protein
MIHKTPLAIYIVWHPACLEGERVAHNLYAGLCRNVEKPLVRHLGIPVYFRGVNESGNKNPRAIDFSESKYTAVVALISDHFVNDKDYAIYLDSIHKTCSDSKGLSRLYPVALSKHAFNVSKNIAALNFIRIDRNRNDCEPNTGLSISEQLKGPLLHELCRLLMNMKKASDEIDSLTLSPPIKLFISHSKHDESKVDAIKFRDYINSQTQLKTFFDANDIAYGSNFGDEIKSAASESALVVFQSDSYADREWCRIEVLTAKSAGCPIVIVNAIQSGEKRAFPYLGNCPSIRFRGNYQAIIDLTLEQVLFNSYTAKFLDSLTDLYNIRADRILSNVPELFNFIQLKKLRVAGGEKFALVIYPDPPLGSEEMDILNQLDDDFAFITPLMLPLISRRNEQKA